MPGRGYVLRVEAAGQRIAGLAVEGEHPGEHVRRVGRLVEQVDDVELGDPGGGVRIGGRGDDKTGAGPAGQDVGIVAGARGEPVAEHDHGERAVAGGGIPDGGGQRPVLATAELELAGLDGEGADRSPVAGAFRGAGAFGGGTF
jgi:hypothetical protein